MSREELIAKLQQIEEQAHFTLEEFPKHLTKERLRMIIALARYVRADLSRDVVLAPLTAEAANEDRIAGASGGGKN